MKQTTFRNIILIIAILAFFVLLCIAYFVMRPKKCPIVTCPVQKHEIHEIHEKQNQTLESRDRKVISDKLYPPLNRSEEKVYVPSTEDSFRLIGYLTSNEYNKDAGNNNWRFFGRMKDRHQGEYYIMPANTNIELKIPLTNEIVVGERLRDIYTLPKEMRFNSPMLNKSVYEFTEIPKSDLNSSKYI